MGVFLGGKKSTKTDQKYKHFQQSSLAPTGCALGFHIYEFLPPQKPWVTFHRLFFFQFSERRFQLRSHGCWKITLFPSMKRNGGSGLPGWMQQNLSVSSTQKRTLNDVGGGDVSPWISCEQIRNTLQFKFWKATILKESNSLRKKKRVAQQIFCRVDLNIIQRKLTSVRPAGPPCWPRETTLWEKRFPLRAWRIQRWFASGKKGEILQPLGMYPKIRW